MRKSVTCKRMHECKGGGESYGSARWDTLRREESEKTRQTYPVSTSEGGDSSLGGRNSTDIGIL